jgi:hypothetical protein
MALLQHTVAGSANAECFDVVEVALFGILTRPVGETIANGFSVIAAEENKSFLRSPFLKTLARWATRLCSRKAVQASQTVPALPVEARTTFVIKKAASANPLQEQKLKHSYRREAHSDSSPGHLLPRRYANNFFDYSADFSYPATSKTSRKSQPSSGWTTPEKTRKPKRVGHKCSSEKLTAQFTS